MTKLFSWFRGLIASFGDDGSMVYTKCQELVERSRHGDQVATAIISRTRKAAEAGSELAKQSLAEIIKYAKSTRRSAFGLDDAYQLHQACFGADVEVIGPQLTKVALKDPDRAIVTVANACDAKELAKKIDACLGNNAFRKVFKNPAAVKALMKQADPATQNAIVLGFVLGCSHRLQLARKPETPLMVFSQRVAWELGQ